MTRTRVTRRETLRIGGAALLTSALTGPVAARLSEPKRILYFTKSSGFQHGVVERHNGRLSHSEPHSGGDRQDDRNGSDAE